MIYIHVVNAVDQRSLSLLLYPWYQPSIDELYILNFLKFEKTMLMISYVHNLNYLQNRYKYSSDGLCWLHSLLSACTNYRNFIRLEVCIFMLRNASILSCRCRFLMDRILLLERILLNRISGFYIIRDLWYIFEQRNGWFVKFLPIIKNYLQFMLEVIKIPLPWQLAYGFTIKVFFIPCFFTYWV